MRSKRHKIVSLVSVLKCVLKRLLIRIFLVPVGGDLVYICVPAFNLKEHCHEDFAVLAQFCAKIITLRL